MALKDPMLQAKSDRKIIHFLRIILGAFFLGLLSLAAFAQEPPLDVPSSAPLARPPQDARAIGDWILYPTLRLYTQYSDNLFLSPPAPPGEPPPQGLNVWGLGANPALVAEWSNGIHTTTLYGNIDREVFPKENEINTFDRQAGIKQRYEALRDLIFSANVDYTHKTVASAFQGSIPTPVAVPATTVLPNGNIQLPNGTILSPTGTPISQANPALTVNGLTEINPSDQYTGTFSVDKYLNRGILGLTTSVARTNFQIGSTQDFTTKSFGGNGGLWLSPLFYAYSNGTVATNTLSSNSTTSYRAIAGIGSRQFGLIKGNAYVGSQGSESSLGGKSGGLVFGGSLSYYPTPPWTISTSFDETINIANSGNFVPQGVLSREFALTFPSQSLLQIPLGESTRTQSISVHTDYKFSEQWFAAGDMTYGRTEFIASPQLDTTWLAHVTLSYAMWRNLSLVWEYQYATVIAPPNSSQSAKRNLVTMSAMYKF